MVKIEITKQPLYGSVYWNGYKFVYTPSNNFTGNDIFYYNKTENGIITSYKEYVNPSNIAPVVTNVSLTADAYTTKVIDVSSLATDSTNPFNELKILSVDSPVIGRIENTGTQLYYYPNSINCVEVLNYVVSDKQYSVTGTLTLNVINGRINIPAESNTFKYELTKFYNIASSINASNLNWDSATKTLTTYQDDWNLVDGQKYINFSNYIESLSGGLNSILNRIPIYDELYSNLSTNSAGWVTDVFLSKLTDYSNTYNILTSKNTIWDSIYTNHQNLTTILDENIPKFQSLSDSITNDSSKWDSQEIYDIVETGKELWNETYTQLSNKNNEWDNVLYSTDNFISETSANFSNFNNIYSILTSNSAIWDSVEAEDSISSSPEWDAVYDLYETYNSLYSLLTGSSGVWIKDTVLTSALTSNSANWNSAYNKLQNVSTIFNTISGLNNLLSGSIINFNNTYNTLTANYPIWSTASVMVSSPRWDAVFSSREAYNNLYSLLTSSSGSWIKDISLTSVLTSNSANWNETYDKLTNNSWDVGGSLSGVIDNYNNAYSILTTNSAVWDTSVEYNFIDLNNTFNIISSLSNQWGQISELSSSYIDNANNYNSVTNTFSTNSSTWNDISNLYINTYLSAINWDKIYSNKDNYDNLYSILYSTSSVWNNDISLLTSISSDISEISDNSNIINDLILSGKWLESGTYYSLLTSAIGNNNIIFTNLYNLISTSSANKWTSKDFYTVKLSAIDLWNSNYDIIVSKNKYTEWNNAVTNLTSLSNNFSNIESKLNILNSIIVDNLSNWNNKTISSILTGNSANWYNTYSLVSTNSSKWSFDEKPEYISSYSYVDQSSANLINAYNNVTAYSANWNDTSNKLTTVSSNYFLTGGDIVNLSAYNLSALGTTHIKGNLSAIGSNFVIDTTLNTTSSFNITNGDSQDALSITKNGGGAILNAYMSASPVLYVKASTKTVGINLSSISENIGDISNVSLTVSGNISATGYIYPFPESITLYSSKSGAYETAYTYLTANSGAISDFILNTKPLYDSMVTYIASGNISSFSAITIPYYNNYFDSVTDYSNKNTIINNFISLYDNSFGTDLLFSANSSKYEDTYKYYNTSTNVNKYAISQFFTGNPSLSSKTISLVIQDNINIQSWNLYANDITFSPSFPSYDLSVDILSTTHGNFGRLSSPPVTMTNGNLLTLTTFNKNSADNLNSVWSGTYLPKGSILQFKLITNNPSVSALLVNLTVQKQ